MDGNRKTNKITNGMMMYKANVYVLLLSADGFIEAIYKTVPHRHINNNMPVYFIKLGLLVMLDNIVPRVSSTILFLIYIMYRYNSHTILPFDYIVVIHKQQYNIAALEGNRTLSSTLEGLHVTTTPLTLIRVTWFEQVTF